ncbi:MAG TPA: DmsE family decaheme c-type cytochrome [Acidobacteriota bacterium]|nr:DmsE family decaheme c-type cytochrome [Acidobacteriota bacterium]
MKVRTRLMPIIPVAVAFAAVLVGAALLKGTPAPQDNQYVGQEQCAACHEETVAQFRESSHGQKGFEKRSSHACETCHGPGKTHVDAGGGKGTMVTIKAMTKEKQSEMCLQCHDRGTKSDWAGSLHEARGLACQDCHSVHSPAAKPQLKAEETDLCFTCHKQKQSQFYRASHHPIREGQMECSSCHNPHAVQDGKFLDQAAVTEKCYECHAEKRGPFIWEHIPVREDCMNCHEPHGSNHLKMLKVKEPFLCQRCHSDTRHPGTLYDQAQLNVDSNRLIGRSCTNCHQTVHGSNHPSGRTYLR